MAHCCEMMLDLDPTHCMPAKDAAKCPESASTAQEASKKGVDYNTNTQKIKNRHY